jgi:hypothetical protein
MNAPVLVPLEGETDPLEIATKELKAKKIPLVVRRYLPGTLQHLRVHCVVLTFWQMEVSRTGRCPNSLTLKSDSSFRYIVKAGAGAFLAPSLGCVLFYVVINITTLVDMAS